MLSNDKLANYNNIQASVEKLTDEKVKVIVVEVLCELSNEELQKINDRSDILDKILRGIECFNKKNTRFFYGKEAIQWVISPFSKGGYDRIIDVNPNVLELLISYQSPTVFYSFNYNSFGGNWNDFSHLNDDRFHCLVKNEDFCEALLKVGHINNFLEISARDDIISNEGFKECINNQDLILVYCLTDKSSTVHSLKDLMLSPDRDSMIGKLRSLQQQGNLRCDEETLNLILFNLPAFKQLVYSDANDDVIETLKSNNFKKIEELISRANEELLEQTVETIGKDISFKYTGEPLVKGTKFGNNPKKLETISGMKFMESKNQKCLMQDYGEKYSEYKKLYMKYVEEKAQQRKAELNQAQVAQAIPNVQSLT